MYRKNQVSKFWDDFLSENLFKIDFKKSKIDECVFFHVKLVFLLCVDGGIIFSLDIMSTDSAIKWLMFSNLKL